jgi:hypothetical protein
VTNQDTVRLLRRSGGPDSPLHWQMSRSERAHLSRGDSCHIEGCWRGSQQCLGSDAECRQARVSGLGKTHHP